MFFQDAAVRRRRDGGREHDRKAVKVVLLRCQRDHTVTIFLN